MLMFPMTRAAAVYTPVTLTGFTQDVVANGTGTPTTSTTTAFDNTAYVLVAQDYLLTASSPAAVYYLPSSGTISSANTPGLNYQLASYTGSNSLRLTGSGSGVLTFGTTGLVGDVYVLGSSGDAGTNGVNATITVHFTDNTTQVFTGVNFPDWYNGSPVAAQGIGRANRTSGVQDGTATNPRLYEKKLTLNLANYTKTISHITVTKTSGLTNSKLNIMAVTVDDQDCVPALNITTNTVTTTSANGTWTAPASTTGYQYAVTTTSTPPATGTAITTNSVSLSNLNVGTTYYLHVRNNCGSGYSVWNTVSFTTLPCPSAGTPTFSNNVPGSVTISWPGSTTSGVAGYQYAVTTNAAPPSSGWTNTTLTTANVTGLTPGVTYYAHVRTNCTNTTAGWANVSFVNPFPPCYEPSNITISNINTQGALIRWNTGLNWIGFRYAVNTSPTPPASGTTTTDTTLEAVNLTPNTKYYVHLRTHCGTTNFSSWKLDSFMTTATCQGPLTPVISNITASSAYIEWNYYPGILGYEYFIGLNNTPPTSGYPTNYHAAAPINLLSGTKYYVFIRTNCDTNEYSPWVVDSFTTVTVCAQPNMPVISAIGPNMVTLDWAAVPGAMHYEAAIDNSPVPPLAGTTVNATTYTNNSLTPNSVYYFHLRAVCSGTDISAWQTLQFTTNPLSIGEPGNGGFSVAVYPNPVRDMLNMEIHGQIRGEAKVMLYDMSGKLVAERTITADNSRLETANLAPGMYILKYVDSETTGTVRIQKQ